MVGRHTRAPASAPSVRRAPRFAILAFAVVGLLLAIGGVAVSRSGSGAAGDGCGPAAIRVQVTASPDIEPVLDRIAGDFAATDVRFDGRCVAVDVGPGDPADVSAVLSGIRAGERPDVWIPDSSTWVARAATGSDQAIAALDVGVPVATTPVVVAVPRPAAEGWGWPERQSSWSDFVTGARRDVGIGILDPRRASTGLSAVAAVTAAASSEANSAPAVVAALQRLARRVFVSADDLRGALPAAGADRPAGFAMTEQAVAAYNAARPPVPLAAMHPGGDAVVLDYPYVAVQRPDGADPLREQALASFRDFVLGSRGQSTLQRAGFRGPDGRTEQPLSAAQGTPPVDISPAPALDAAAAEKLVGTWAAVNLGTRMLAVMDVSGSMGEAVPGTGKSRLQIAVAGAGGVLRSFRRDAALGLWVFSTQLTKSSDHQELVPIERLSATRGGRPHAALLAERLAAVQTKPRGGTALYDTTLAAVRAVRTGYDPSAVNSVVLLTDGKNDEPDSISLAELERTLREEARSNQPVPVFTVAFGPDADAAALARIAGVTGGKAYAARNPEDLRAVLADGIAQRACRPDCR